jgi:hypothetical protein
MSHSSNVPIDIDLSEISEIAAQAEERLNRHQGINKNGSKVPVPEANQAVLKKISKILSESEIEDLDAMSEDDLRSRIVTVQRQRSDNAVAREVDVDLKKAKEEVKELAAPYTEVEKRLSAITDYAVLRLSQLGK